MKNLLPKINSLLIYLNLFFLQSYLIRFNIANYPTNLQEVLILANFITFTGLIISKKQFKQTVRNILNHWPIIALSGLTIFSLVTNPTLSQIDALRHLKFFLFAIILTFIVLETFTQNKEREKAVQMAGFGAIAFGIFSLFYNLFGYNVSHDLRLLGPLDSAVYLAFYLTPFFLYFAIKFLHNPKLNNLNLIYALILGLLILATKSMGAIGGSFFILLLFLIKNSHIPLLKKTATKIAITALSLLVVGTIFYTKILPTLQTEYSSLDERGQIWQTAFYLLKDPNNLLFGLGPSQFEYHYIENVDAVLGHQPLDYYVIQPHNIFLLFHFHYGLFGTIFLLFLIYHTLKKLFQTSQTGNQNMEQIGLFIFTYFLLHGLIDTPFYKNDLLILFILFLELAHTDSKPLNSFKSGN